MIRSRYGFVLALLGFAALQPTAQAQINYYYAGNGTALNTANWSTTAGGPYGINFVNGNNVVFEVAGTATGATITTTAITATANTTFTVAGGTISNQGNAVIPITVAAGITLDFSSQSFTSSATAGYIKNGDGVLALGGNTYGGGFTLNAGTVILRGINALGNAATNSLTIGGGIIAANNNRDLTGRFGAGININANFQLGAATGLASNTANITFSNNTNLGGANRTITIGSNGTHTLGGVISNGGLTLASTGGATGNLTLTGANTYAGNTVINGATLFANTTGAGNSATGTGTIAINSGGTLAGTGNALGNVSLNLGGRITAGTGTAVGQTLTVNALTVDAGSNFRTFVGNVGTPTDLTTTGASQVNVIGTFDVTPTLLGGGGAMNIELIGSGFTLNQPYTRRIITHGALGGTFGLAGTPPYVLDPGDPQVTVTTTGFVIDQTVATGWRVTVDTTFVDISFTPIPEPGTMLGLGALGLGGIGLIRRIRRRSA